MPVPPPPEPPSPEVLAALETAKRFGEAVGQVEEVHQALDLPADRYLHFPFAPVDALVGGMRPGSLWFPVAFSGDGKSSFLMSALERWLNQGMRVAYQGLETKPWKLRVHLACRQLGVDPGDIITGAILSHPEGARIREEVKHLAGELLTDDWTKRIKFFPQTFIGPNELETLAEQVVDMEADVWVIDHIDHVQGGDGSNPYAESRKVLERLFDLKQSLDLTIVAASQLNNEAVRGDPLARYRPAEPNMIYMGAHKRMVADGMLSIYRPLQPPPQDPEDLKAWRDRLKDVRQGVRKAREMLLQNTMGVAITKHREYNREGLTCFLQVERGKVRELEHHEAAARGLLTEKY
jgi:KaiC/GvpD/RAD55 family RecA-like ATPase